MPAIRSPYPDERPPAAQNGHSHNGDHRGGDRGRRHNGSGGPPVSPAGGYERLDWSEAGGSRGGDEHEESWTDRKMRERYGGRRPRPYDRSEDNGADDSWSRDSGSWQGPISGEPMERVTDRPVSRGRRRAWSDDDSSTNLLGEAHLGGERWAPVQTNGSGHENGANHDPGRGRRRTPRYRDDSSTDLRDEGRAPGPPRPDDTGSFRRGDTGGFQRGDTGGFRRGDTGGFQRGDTGGFRRGDTGSFRRGDTGSFDRPNPGYDRSANGNGYGGASYGQPDYTRRALPPGSSEPSSWGGQGPRDQGPREQGPREQGPRDAGRSWNDDWDEPVRERRGHRYRPDFELTDERWR